MIADTVRLPRQRRGQRPTDLEGSAGTAGNKRGFGGHVTRSGGSVPSTSAPKVGAGAGAVSGGCEMARLIMAAALASTLASSAMAFSAAPFSGAPSCLALARAGSTSSMRLLPTTRPHIGAWGLGRTEGGPVPARRGAAKGLVGPGAAVTMQSEQRLVTKPRTSHAW